MLEASFTVLILGPLPEAKSLEERSRGRKRGGELDHASGREASLPSSRMRGVGFGAIPKLHLGSYRSVANLT
jgi:hypothetical protein